MALTDALSTRQNSAVSDGENVLSKVPGHYVAQAILSLPDAQLSVEEVMEATIDVPGLGRLKITCRKFRHRKGRSARVFWTAERAVKED
jgi:hypothetical protein